MIDFRPLPLLGNPHVQTILAALLGAPEPEAVVRCVSLPDGDRIVLHDSVPPRWRDGRAMVLLVHGLSGSHRSGYMRRVAVALLRRGMRVVRMDLRGAGLGVSLARKSYNAACSGDIRVAVEHLGRLAPNSPLMLAGFSLGGSIVLKLAGEAATSPLPSLRAVAAVAPPIDLEQSAALLALPRNRIYDRRFVRNLKTQVRRHWRYFPDVPRVRFPKDLTMRGFDEVYTAPRGGFDDALDYYRRAASFSLIPQIQTPALILGARDDPFVPVEPFENLKGPGHVEVHISGRGGHLGFLGWDGNGGIRWAERRVVEWLTCQV